MQEKIKMAGDVTVCSLIGEININTSPDLRKVFDELITKKATRVILDLKDVSYIDSSGLATLIEMLRRMKKYEGKLRLCNLSDKVRSLFEITKLTKLFEMFNNEEEALKGF
jgi:anti-sigma B factor antagonist